MKAMYTQTDGTHGTIFAEVIVPRQELNGDTVLYGFDKSEDCGNTNRATSFAGSLTYYKITKD